MCRCRQTPAQYKERTKKSYLKQKPAALAKRRARDALSPPPREYKITKRPRSCKKNTPRELRLPLPQSSQDECDLLGKLPAEVRLQIWSEVVGGRTIHVLRKMGKLGHRICVGEGCEDCPGFVARYQPGVPPREVEPFSREKELSSEGFLALLRTCRQIYAEATPLLYTANTFDFPHVWNLNFFRSTTLPHRFASLRNISITHRFEPALYESTIRPQDIGRAREPLIPFPSHEENWTTAAANLNALANLRSLEFRISRTMFRNTSAVPGGVQKPFAALAELSTRLQDFVIKIPYAEPWYNVDAKVMQKGLEEMGVKARVVQEVKPPGEVFPPLPPPPLPAVVQIPGGISGSFSALGSVSVSVQGG